MPLEERLGVNLEENSEVVFTMTALCATNICLISQSSVSQTALPKMF